MKVMFKLLGLLVGVPTVAIAIFYVWASSGSYDKQNYAAIVDYGAAAASVTAKDSYTIVSYNLGYLSGLANNTTVKPEKAFFEANQTQAITALKSINPDIVAFQEIDFGADRSYGVNQAQTIANALGLGAGAIAINWDKTYLPFPYWPVSAHFGKILSGQAVLSRYPIEKNSRTVLQKVAGNNFIYNAFYLDRVVQASEVDMGGRKLVVMNTHLEAFDEETRVAQTQVVRSLAEEYAQTHPVILLGDFNSALNRDTFITASGEELGETKFSIQEMTASEVFASAVVTSDWSSSDNATFPSDSPEYKLDYIFYTPSTLEVLQTQVVTEAGEASDHLPLMATFRFKE